MAVSKSTLGVCVSVFFAVAMKWTPMPENWRPYACFLAWLACGFCCIAWWVAHISSSGKLRFKPKRNGIMTLGIVFLVGGGIAVLLWILIIPKPAKTDITVSPLHQVGNQTRVQNDYDSTANLPVFGFDVVVRLYLRPNGQRQYLFDAGTKDKERLSVYITPDDIFTVLFMDAYGEPHPLQLPLNSKDFKPGERIHLWPEVITGDNYTIIRASINNEQIGSIKLPFKAKLGALSYQNGIFGGNLDESDGASFDLIFYAAFKTTMTEKMRNLYLGDVDTLLKAIPDKPYFAFDGTKVLKNGDIKMSIESAKNPPTRDFFVKPSSAP